MPAYDFAVHETDELVEVVMTVAEMESRVEDGEIVLDDGRKARRVYIPTSKKARGTWPLLSEAMGVHPSQVKEAERMAASKGVPTDFTTDGRPILTSARHRKRYAEAHGYYDRNGGFGDPQKR